MQRHTIAALALLTLASCGGPTPPPDDVTGCPASDRYIVYAAASVSGASVLDATVTSAGGTVLTALPEVGAMAICAGPSERVTMTAGGVTVEPDYPVTIPPGESTIPVRRTSITASLGQWHLSRTRAPSAWATGQGAGAVIHVLDTGADCSAGIMACVGGRDYVGGRPCGAGLACDGHGHGTHVASTAAEVLDNAGGTGLAPLAGLYIRRVLDDQGSGWSSDIARAILDAGADARSGTPVVISMSLGTSEPSTAVRDAIAYATAGGARVVAARGNAGGTAPTYPVCFEPVVGVVATDQDDRRASFSDHGRCSDIGAPGVAILAAWIGGTYREASGTSMSTPMVAAALAILMALGDADPVTTLLRTAAAGVDSTVPAGRLDVAAAVLAARPGATATAGSTATGYTITSEPTHNPYPGPGTPTWSPTPTVPTWTPAPTRTRTATATARPTNTALPAASSTSTIPPPVIATSPVPPTGTRTATVTRTATATATPCVRDIEVWTRGRPNGWTVVRVLCVPTAVRP